MIELLKWFLACRSSSNVAGMYVVVIDPNLGIKKLDTCIWYSNCNKCAGRDNTAIGYGSESYACPGKTIVKEYFKLFGSYEF